MDNVKAASIVVELLGEFTHLKGCSGRQVDPKFAEAVALACMALRGKD